MIVYASGFPAAESAAGRSLLLPRIIYNNWIKDLTAAAITASGETTTGPKDSPLRPETHEFWLPPSLTATWQVELGATRSVSAIGIASHTLGSKAATVLAETQLGAAAFSTFAASHSPTSDAEIVFMDAPRNIDRVRFTITGTGGVPQIAVVSIADTLIMEKPLQIGYKPAYMNLTSVRQSNVSRGGHYLGQDSYRKGVESNLSFMFLSETFVRNSFMPFARATRNYSYFFCGRPDSDLNDVTYCWHEKDLDPSYHMSLYLRVAWTIFGLSPS